MKKLFLTAAAILMAFALSGCTYPIISEYNETPASSQSGPEAGEFTSPVPGTSAASVSGLPAADLTGPEPDFASLLATLPAITFEGRDFSVVSFDSTVGTIVGDETSPFFAARDKRTSAVAEKYGVNFIGYTLPADEAVEKLRVSAASGGEEFGSFYADLLEVPEKNAGRLVTAGLLSPFNVLPFYSQPDNENALAGRLDGKRWFDVSAIADDPENLYVLYFDNTDGCRDRLYRLSADGKFTFEAFFGEVKDSTQFASEDGWGFAVSDGDGPALIGEAAVIRSGRRFTSSGSGNRTVSWLDEGTLAYFEGIFSAAASSRAYRPAGQDDPSPAEVFLSGKTAFYVGKLDEIGKTLYSSQLRWGVVALPSEDGCTVSVRDNPPVLCLPVINKRTEMTGVVMSALLMTSGNWIRESYLPVFASEYIRDNDSYYSLKAILSETAYYDFSYIFEETAGLPGATHLGCREAAKGATSVSAIFAERIAAANASLFYRSP